MMNVYTCCDLRVLYKLVKFDFKQRIQYLLKKAPEIKQALLAQYYELVKVYLACFDWY